MTRYEIAFSGRLVEGAPLVSVQANLARLFQADAQRIAQLFSGRRVVIKNNLDEVGAEKYRLTLERAGAVVEVLAMLVEEVELTPPPAPVPVAAASTVAAVAAVAAVASPASPGRLQVAPRDEYMAAFVDVEAPDFGIAPVGVDLQDAKPEAPAPVVDLSQFSLAPAGSDMGQAKTAPAGPPPDTSYLSLQE